MTIWTPDGERPVSNDSNPSAESQDGAIAPEYLAELENMTDEQRAQAEAMIKQLAEAREQLLAASASEVLANHAIGIYELAAIHLGAEEPNFEEAQLAVDGFAALVEGLKGRLGEGEDTLNEALGHIRLQFVQLKSQKSPETK